MLLQALHDYGVSRRLLERAHLRSATIHALIPIDAEGRLRGDAIDALYRVEAVATKKGVQEKQRLGRELEVPQFPGENNGGKAHFLFDSVTAVLGISAKTALPLLVAPPREDRNPTRSFQHFWERIESAHEVTHDARLAAILRFRETYIRESEERYLNDAPFLVIRRADDGTASRLLLRASGGSELPAEKMVLGLTVDGRPAFDPSPDDPLTQYWRQTYFDEAAAADAGPADGHDESDEPDSDGAADESAVCMVTGETGQPIARSHPKILRVPGLTSGGRIVSYAKDKPAFSSFGFHMGGNAPVTRDAATLYGAALNSLLRDEDTHLVIGDAAFCFWTRRPSPTAGHVRRLAQGNPAAIADFLRSPYAGIERSVEHSDLFYSTLMSGARARVIVRGHGVQPVHEVIGHLQRWFADLNLRPTLYGDARGFPLALSRLSDVCVSHPKNESAKALRTGVAETLRATAFEGRAPPLSLLKPLLDGFRSALLRDSEDEPTWPYGTSRFALLRLILVRNRKEDGFMPEPQLAETSDPAYNLGRLFAVFERLQDAAHRDREQPKSGEMRGEFRGAGVVERYFGAASAAPAAAFPILFQLSRNHLRKLESREEIGTAQRIEGDIRDICSRFAPEGPGKPPAFRRFLTLEEQGRFALGFYQQKAHRLGKRQPADQDAPPPVIDESESRDD